ncbi:hypothetical protein D3C71_1543560 [compost metagenome]
MCEPRQVVHAGNFKHILTHYLRLNIEGAVIKGVSVHRFTGVGILRIKDDNISAVKDMFFIVTNHKSFALFNKTYNVIVMKMVREFLHDPFKAIRLKIQAAIEDDGPNFTSHCCTFFSSYV